MSLLGEIKCVLLLFLRRNCSQGSLFLLGLNYLSCLNFSIFNYDNFVLLCIHHPSLHPSPLPLPVRPSVRPIRLAGLNVPTPPMIEFLLVFSLAAPSLSHHFHCYSRFSPCSSDIFKPSPWGEQKPASIWNQLFCSVHGSRTKP